MKKKNSKLKLTLKDLSNKEKVIAYLDEHYTKGDIFEILCDAELVIDCEIPWRTTKMELIEPYWEELADILIVSNGEVNLDE